MDLFQDLVCQKTLKLALDQGLQEKMTRRNSRTILSDHFFLQDTELEPISAFSGTLDLERDLMTICFMKYPIFMAR